MSQPPPIILSADQGIHVPAPNASGKQDKPIERIAANEKLFVLTEQIAEIAALSPEFRRWKRFSEELCKRPDLVAYYDFQPDENDRNVLRNRAKSGTRLDGRIEGAKWADGPIRGKQALEFSGRGDRVRVNLPDRLEAVTAVVWLRIDALPNEVNSILMSDRWFERIGACHWQIASGDNHLQFAPCPVTGIDPEPADFRQVLRSPNLDRGDFHAWRQLAVVYDSASGMTTFYRNGQEIGSAKISGQIPIEFGPSQIANWEPARRERPMSRVRNLQTRISELFLISRALPATEVKRLYDSAAVEPNDKGKGT